MFFYFISKLGAKCSSGETDSLMITINYESSVSYPQLHNVLLLLKLFKTLKMVLKKNGIKLS